jgi:hypothetical protein
MEKLRSELDVLIAALPNAEVFRSSIEMLVSVYPFNEYEYIIATLLAADRLTHDNIGEFSVHEAQSNQLAAAIRSAHKRQKN